MKLEFIPLTQFSAFFSHIMVNKEQHLCWAMKLWSYQEKTHSQLCVFIGPYFVKHLHHQYTAILKKLHNKN